MMKLIFIYGSPAVGKLTVARELSKISDYKLFHNHLTLDFAKLFLEWGTSNFWKLVRTLRLEIVSLLARTEQKGLIFTFVYNGTKEEDLFISKLVKKVEEANGKVCFVQLIANPEILKKRVVSASRKKYAKINKISTLLTALELNKNNKAIKRNPHYSIDNSKDSAKSVALRIENWVARF